MSIYIYIHIYIYSRTKEYVGALNVVKIVDEIQHISSHPSTVVPKKPEIHDQFDEKLYRPGRARQPQPRHGATPLRYESPVWGGSQSHGGYPQMDRFHGKSDFEMDDEGTPLYETPLNVTGKSPHC